MEKPKEEPAPSSEKPKQNGAAAKSNHHYYELSKGLEKKLVKMNLILTIFGIIAMLFEISYGVAVWNVK